MIPMDLSGAHPTSVPPSRNTGLVPLPESRAFLPSRGALVSPISQSHHVEREAPSPVDRKVLSDGPFLVKDKVAALERYAVEIGELRPRSPWRRRPVPQPITVVGMQTQIASSSRHSVPHAVPVSVHEAIIADTVARLTEVFQNRLHEHAIATTVRFFASELVEDLRDEVTALQTPSVPSAIGSRVPSVIPPVKPSHSATLLPTFQPHAPATARALSNPPLSSNLSRLASPHAVLRKVAGRVMAIPTAPVARSQSSSTSTPINHKSHSARLSGQAEDLTWSLLMHPAVTAPWMKRSSTSGRVLDPLPPSSGTMPAPPKRTQQWSPLPSLKQAGDAIAPQAEEALGRILNPLHATDVHAHAPTVPLSTSAAASSGAAVMSPLPTLDHSAFDAAAVDVTLHDVPHVNKHLHLAASSASPHATGSSTLRGTSRRQVETSTDHSKSSNHLTAANYSSIDNVASQRGYSPLRHQNSSNTSAVVDHMVFDTELGRWVSTRSPVNAAASPRGGFPTVSPRHGPAFTPLPQLFSKSPLVSRDARVTTPAIAAQRVSPDFGLLRRSSSSPRGASPLHAPSPPQDSDKDEAPGAASLLVRRETISPPSSDAVDQRKKVPLVAHDEHVRRRRAADAEEDSSKRLRKGRSDETKQAAAMLRKSSPQGAAKNQKAGGVAAGLNENRTGDTADDANDKKKGQGKSSLSGERASSPLQRKESLRVPSLLQGLVPVPLNAIIPPLPNHAVRTISTDQIALEAQVERDVIVREYDSVANPLRAVKKSVDDAAQLLHSAMDGKLELRNQLIKKYDALQNVKSSHLDVMKAVEAVHTCLVSGKSDVSQIPIDVILKGMKSLADDPLSPKKSMRKVGSLKGGRRGSHASKGKDGSGGSPHSPSSGGGAASGKGKSDEKKKRRSTTTVSLDHTLPGGSGSLAEDISIVASEDSSDEDAGRVGDSRRGSESMSPRTIQKSRRPTVALPAAALDAATAASGPSGPTTAEMLKQAHRARALSQAASPTHRDSLAGAADDGAPRRNSRVLRSMSTDHRRGSVAGGQSKQTYEEVALQKTLTKASQFQTATQQRFRDAHAYLVHHGRNLIRQRQRGGSTVPNSTSAPADISKLAQFMKRDSIACDEEASSPVSSNPNEDREALVAAISEELQAEFRDINARRDHQKSIVEAQEKEMEEVRADMKKLTSSTDTSRDEFATMLTETIQRRESMQQQLREDPLRSAMLVGTENLAVAVAAGLSTGVAETSRRASSMADGTDSSMVEVDDDDDGSSVVGAGGFRHRAEFIELRHVAIQADESQAPTQTTVIVGADGSSRRVSPSSEGLHPPGAGGFSVHVEDLFRLERALMMSVKRLTIAVANIVMFHEAIEMDITCKQCLKLLHAPRVLWPCGHVFCHECLTEMYEESAVFTCAECQTLVDIGFTPDPAIENITSVTSQYRAQAARREKERRDAASPRPLGSSARSPREISLSSLRPIESAALESDVTCTSLNDVLQMLLKDLTYAELGTGASSSQIVAAQRASLWNNRSKPGVTPLAPAVEVPQLTVQVASNSTGGGFDDASGVSFLLEVPSGAC